MRVISSPSISTMGFFATIFAIAASGSRSKGVEPGKASRAARRPHAPATSALLRPLDADGAVLRGAGFGFGRRAHARGIADQVGCERADDAVDERLRLPRRTRRGGDLHGIGAVLDLVEPARGFEHDR